MGRKKAKKGRCWLCGIEGKLSFEHVPPEKAFNDRRIFNDSVANILKNRNIKISQRGAGEYTLCERCNNNTGSWYGGAFVEFCKQAVDVLYRADGSPTLHYEYKTYPLSILKQIVTMLFSANGPEWRESCPELVKFVLNKEQRFLPPEYRIYIYYNIEGSLSKQTGIQIKGEFDSLGIPSSTVSKISEIVYPPLGYVMTIESDTPDPRLFEVSRFDEYRYDEFSHINLKLPVLPVYTMYAGHYPSSKDIEEIDRKYPDEPSIHHHIADIVDGAVERLSK